MYVLPYGKGHVTLQLPAGVEADWITYRRPAGTPDAAHGLTQEAAPSFVGETLASGVSGSAAATRTAANAAARSDRASANGNAPAARERAAAGVLAPLAEAGSPARGGAAGATVPPSARLEPVPQPALPADADAESNTAERYARARKAAAAHIEHALGHPIGAPHLRDAARGCRSAVILISDMTRLCPSYVFLDRLLDELNGAGIPDAAIHIIVALGMHRKMTAGELAALVGPTAYLRVPVLNHSPLAEDCVRLGVTGRGTPVEINRLVVEADFRIVTGSLEPHLLAGVSGGVKALVPGVASAACIEANHALSLSGAAAQPGSPANTVRADMEEALRFLPVHYLLNVVVDHERQVLGAVAGDVIAAHRAGLQLVRDCFLVEVPQRYELTIVSAGGFPKDTQLYQAVKSLKNAAAITRPGGRILLLAQCEELYGNGIFQFWVETIGDRSRMTAKLQERFVLGAHKIESIAQVLSRHEVHLYSGVPAPTAELVGFQPIGDLHAAVAELTSSGQMGTAARIALMPYGGLTFPRVCEQT